MSFRHYAAIAFGLLVITTWNVWAAQRDSNGMRCYAQPVSVECPAK